jgi:spore maturation protein CgeB
MKVHIFGSDSHDTAAANCGLALRGMGHEIRHFDSDEHPSYLAPLRRSIEAKRITNRLLDLVPRNSRFWESAFLRDAESFGPDLILVLPIYALRPSVVREVKRRTGARIAAWYQDHVVNMGQHEYLLAEYDGLFFKDPYIVERLRDYGGFENVHFLPEACEPRRHHPLALSEEDERRYRCDLLTYGNLYPYRARLLESLLDRDLHFYGALPRLVHPVSKLWRGRPIFSDDKIKAVLGAKIIVNSSHFGEVFSVNARVFEVAGIGGFQVADAPGVADYFTPGREIVTFKGPRQLREVIDHYLARPDERREIAARGCQRAHREHTYEKRLRRMFEVLRLAQRAAPDAGGMHATAN